MLNSLERIANYNVGGREAFMQSTLVQDATMRNLEIVGEATKNLSADLRASSPEIPWARMSGMRDVLIHNYIGVDLEIVWGVVEDEISPLIAGLLALIEEPDET